LNSESGIISSYKYPFSDAEIHPQFTHKSSRIHFSSSYVTMSHNTSHDNESVYNTPPEDNSPQNTPREDLFPVFQYDNPPPATPPEVMFPPENKPPPNNPPPNNQPPNFPPQNQPNTFGLTDEELYEQDMQVFLEFEAEQERQSREHEAYLKGKEDRRNQRAEWRWKMGLPRVPSSEDDSSASYSSDEGYGTD
jgi:hypothetical protein